MRVYGYFVLPDGSVCRKFPLLETGCGVVASPSKREAEMSMSYLDPIDIYAEVQYKEHRILFVRSGALTGLGLNAHLFLGMDTSSSVEVIDVGSSGLAWAIIHRLRENRCAVHDSLISIKKSGRIRFGHTMEAILKSDKGITADRIRLVDEISKSHRCEVPSM